LSVLELGLQNRSKTTVGYPAIVYVGNLHGDEPVTTEILLNLVHHLLSSYNSDNKTAKFLTVCEHWYFDMFTVFWGTFLWV
jgi:hypothetical protein